METIPLDLTQANSYEALLAFLEGCREKAATDSESKLVSIAAQSDSLDPLAVLESIYEEKQWHFYVERPSENFALAGADEAISCRFDGPDRFEKAKSFVDKTLENTIAIGDSTLPFFGPLFFSAFAFEDDCGSEAPFAGATLFVPLWLVGLKNGRCVAIANALIEADSDIAVIAGRIWKANAKFRSFDYSEPELEDSAGRLEVVDTAEFGGSCGFLDGVEAALIKIEQGVFGKIVLARALDVRANRHFDPLGILNTLRERYPDCYSFSIANGEGYSFIGASPERLVSVNEGVLNVDILAGTAPRGMSASEDARFGKGLLRSEKDVREHRIVFDSVARRLEGLGVEVPKLCSPVLRKLQNVQHLHVDLEASVPDGIHLLDLVSELHPTPAVGGMPREKALPYISQLEAFDRGLYAGAVGWIDSKGDGDFFVGIRSALVKGETARLYAGVGIVRGSDADKELSETNLKFKALQENLL